MKHYLRFVILFSAAFALQACVRNLTGTDLAGNYVNNLNGDKDILNSDGTGYTLSGTGRRFEIKYRVESNKVFMQGYPASDPKLITNTTYERENNGDLCIVEPKTPVKICNVKQ